MYDIQNMPRGALSMTWRGDRPEGTIFMRPDSVAMEFDEIKARLENLGSRCFVVRDSQGNIGVATQILAEMNAKPARYDLLATLPTISEVNLGSSAFQKSYGVKYSYMAGAMAKGISSTDLVIALGSAGMLSSFGAGGLSMAEIEKAIDIIQAALPHEPYAFNLIHSPNDPDLERQTVELFLRKGVKIVEASAFLSLTPSVVRYRVSGLKPGPFGTTDIENKVIAKISRLELATQFMSPPPENLVADLLKSGLISAAQADMAKSVPMADDVIVESDSGGHTDNRPLVCLFPPVLALSNRLQAQFGYRQNVRVGAAGGIGTPESAFGCFAMGADFVVTGSINQSCIEAGTSDAVKKMLADVEMTDTIMCPSAEMFEMGARVQVLKKGTLFGVRAQKLYSLYRDYESWDEIPLAERASLEARLFRKSFDDIWLACIDFFAEREPKRIISAEKNPREKMALVFRWYLGLSSFWAKKGVAGRESDYQVWCGPAMGAFNQWCRGTRLENPSERTVADVALQLLRGAAYLSRLQTLAALGVEVDPNIRRTSVKTPEHRKGPGTPSTEYARRTIPL